MPAFWFGIVLIEIFALHLHVLARRRLSGGFFGQHLESLVLPALTASFAIVPMLVRSLRVGMVEVLDADFIAAARAKGLGELRVLFSHVARNALIPTLTLLGLNIAYPHRQHGRSSSRSSTLNGLGSLLLDAIPNRDFPVVQAITLVLGDERRPGQPRRPTCSRRASIPRIRLR